MVITFESVNKNMLMKVYLSSIVHYIKLSIKNYHLLGLLQEQEDPENKNIKYSKNTILFCGLACINKDINFYFNLLSMITMMITMKMMMLMMMLMLMMMMMMTTMLTVAALKNVTTINDN